MKELKRIIERDDDLFFGLYEDPIIVYLEFVQKQEIGDPNTLGRYNFNRGSKSDVSYEGTIDDMVGIGAHEVYHAMLKHTETQHQLMEANGVFNDSRNYRKLRRKIDPRYN